jgi:alkaline phosphatase
VPARNVILMIGEGPGDSEITMARNDAVGASGRPAIDGFPHTSAWAIGHQTYHGALSIDPVTCAPLTHATPAAHVAHLPADRSPGAIATLLTADGRPMVVGCATDLIGREMNHTCTQVPVVAAGPSADQITGVLDEHQLHGVLARAPGLPE